MAQDSAIHSFVLGFGHRARHGKDTVAAAIRAARGQTLHAYGKKDAPLDAWTTGYDIRLYSFAKELKEEVNAVYEQHGSWPSTFLHLRTAGVPLKDGSRLLIPSWVYMEVDPDMNDPLCPYGKHRALLQWWGSEYRRNNFGENYWVERAAARLAAEKPEIALFTDMRFPNEMAFIKEYGLAIKVQRPGLASPNAHISEEALAHVPDNEWDAIITNDGSLEDLKTKAVQVFDDLMACNSVEQRAS